MKVVHILLCLLLWTPVVAQPGTQKPAPENLLSTLKQGHPRLLLLKGEEATLLRQVKKDEGFQRVHTTILAESDRIIDLPPVERIQIGRRLLDKSRECLRRVFQLSYAYRTTGEEKYLRRAEKELLAVAAFSDWNPSHFLDVAEMTMAVAIGYDWLYEALPASTRSTLKEAIIEKGINPSFDKKYNSFLNAEHNWNQVCNAGMTYGVLAIAEDEPELAKRVISRALETIPKSMHPYGPDGAYPEGFGYWEYGTSFNVMFLSALEKALGTDFGLSETPGFLQAGYFQQNMVGPLGLVHNWGDSGLKGGLSPAMFWFAARQRDPSLLWNQKPLMAEKAASDAFRNRLLPALLVWGASVDMNAVKPPKTKIWVGQGDSPVALMRTSWTDPNAIFVGFKGGSSSVNHAHMDAGSFVLDALGERWAMDFGPQEYNSLEARGIKLFGRTQDAERWDIFRYNNLVHNTLTFDNQHQQVKGYAKIDRWTDAPSHLALTSDLSSIYAGQVASAQRGIAIVDEKYVVIRDEVKALDKATTLRWTLLTAAKVNILDGKTVELSQNGKKMYLTFDAKVPLTLKTWSTVPTHDYDAPNPGTYLVGFEAEIPAGTEQAFNASFSTNRTTKPFKPLAQWPVKAAAQKGSTK
ncbi:heparinase II/III domain-containing protein [Telluribacter sp.]|jgi:hypothetical protein|uniref:heparinase II/III domain-containing protein n=1 Tax=Telluribacter sp. TaxID=1978767 RepID=UPI002E153CCA|nr:heparinase II/III family protein [Telluribacter sp.]